jgi:hypothetical protein
VSPQVKIHRIQVKRVWRPRSGSSCTCPSVMIGHLAHTAKMCRSTVMHVPHSCSARAHACVCMREMSSVTPIMKWVFIKHVLNLRAEYLLCTFVDKLGPLLINKTSKILMVDCEGVVIFLAYATIQVGRGKSRVRFPMRSLHFFN